MCKKVEEVMQDLEEPSMVKVFIQGINLPDIELNGKCMSFGANNFKILIVPPDIAEFYLKENSSKISRSYMEPVQNGNCIIYNTLAKVIKAENTEVPTMEVSCSKTRSTYSF